MMQSRFVQNVVLAIFLTSGMWSNAILAQSRVSNKQGPASPKEHGKKLTEDSLDKAVERGLEYVAEGGQEWIDDRGCVTCHQVTFMILSHHEARQAGFQVDRKRLDRWAAWSFNWQNWVNPDREISESKAKKTNPDTLAQLILSRPRDQKPQPWVREYAELIALAQETNGLWKAGGQLPGQKRPLAETQEVSTAWNLLALQRSALKTETVTDAIKKAAAALNSPGSQQLEKRQLKTGESTEWWAVRLIVESQQKSAESATKYISGLLERQNRDGGWGWRCDEESDAFGTGLALYALSHVESNPPRTAIQRAQQFLIETQQPSGRWNVKSTLKRSRKIKKVHTSVWGSAWAIIGLVRTRSMVQ